MRKQSMMSIALAASALILASAFAPLAAQQPPPQQAGQQPAPPKAYKPVPVKLPQPVNDPTFGPFLQQLTAVAQKKDRAALAQMVWQNFFWIPEDRDAADKSKPAIDNLAKAIGLDGRDPPGWEVLIGYAGENTADPLNDPQRPNVICGPGAPVIDEAPLDELLTGTQTDLSEWAYPSSDGIEVRSAAQQTAPVIEKLGMHLVRAYPDESAANAAQSEMLRIVAPSGKIGFIPADSVLPLASDQICYVKDGTTWKIAGVLGGAPSQ